MGSRRKGRRGREVERLGSRTTARLLAAAFALWALSGATYGTVLLTFGARPAFIHVRWAPQVTDTIRTREEQKYSLLLPEFKESRTWGYALTDVSSSNVRALVEDPFVEDTQYINRVKFRPGLFTPRLPYQTPAPWIPAALNSLAVALLLGGSVAAGLALLELVLPAAVLARPRRVAGAPFVAPRATAAALSRRVAAWTGEHIPPASAEAAGLFRIAFGTALLALLLGHPVMAAWAVTPDNVLSPLHHAALGVFAQMPSLVGVLRPWLIGWGVLFVAGLWTRPAFAMLTIGALAWGLLYTTRVSHHTVSALMLTLLFLQGVRWGDAWSIDAWRRRGTTHRQATPRHYGYVAWLPSFALGVVLAAAAIAKLRESGLAWIANGTVRYHFLSDSRQAPVDWGVRLGRHEWLAVLFSFAAIAVEGLVIVGVLSRAYRYRAVAGLAAAALLTGFLLFQGLWWPAWWLLLLSFLPWHLIGSPSKAAVAMPHASPWRSVATAAIALVALQLAVTTWKLELAPLLSTYDMYSTTYASEEEYEAKAAMTYWIVARLDDTRVDECAVSRAAAEAMARALADGARSTAAGNVLDSCFGSGAPLRSVSVEGHRSLVDWHAWPPAAIVRLPIAGPGEPR